MRSTIHRLTSFFPIPAADTGSKEAAPAITRQIDLRDKIALITGANSGVGFDTSVHLARQGCYIVMCCRNVDKADDARKLIMERANIDDLSRIRIVELELSDMDDVESFLTRYDREMGEELKSRPIDMLILNAGIMAPPNRELSKQGFESQLATNVLGHFKLLYKLFDKVKQAPHGRIVFTGSQIHFVANGKIDFDDLNRDKAYWKWLVYGETKFGFLLVAQRVSRLLKDINVTNVTCVAAHPGYAATKIHVHTVVGYFNNYFAQSADISAKSIVLAATDPNAPPGGYCGPKHFLYGDPAWGAKRSSTMDDVEMQDRFWNVCESLTKVQLESKIRGPQRRVSSRDGQLFID